MAFNTHVFIELWEARPLSLTIVLTAIFSARVFMPLFLFKALPCNPFGNADLFIRVLTDPESRRALRNFLLLTVPTSCVDDSDSRWSLLLQFDFRVQLLSIFSGGISLKLVKASTKLRRGCAVTLRVYCSGG